MPHVGTKVCEEVVQGFVASHSYPARVKAALHYASPPIWNENRRCGNPKQKPHDRPRNRAWGPGPHSRAVSSSKSTEPSATRKSTTHRASMMRVACNRVQRRSVLPCQHTQNIQKHKAVRVGDPPLQSCWRRKAISMLLHAKNSRQRPSPDSAPHSLRGKRRRQLRRKWD